MSDCDSNIVIVEEAPPAKIVLAAADQGPQGIQGPEGETGPEGPIGPQGPPGEGTPFVFEQQVPALVWSIEHDLHHIPQVTVTDTAGTEIGLFGCTFPDLDHVVLTFSPAPFSGTATLL